MWIPSRTPFLFEPFYDSGNYGRTSPVSWIDRESKTTRAGRTVQAYVQMLLTGRLDWDELAQIYQPIKTVRKLFRKPQIQELIRQELRRNYAGYTVSPGELVQMYEELQKLALEERDLISFATSF